MICKSTLAIDILSNKDFNIDEYGPVLYFRMINKCLTVQQPHLSLKEKLKIDLFEPVYSRKTGFIYFNDGIAKCNNVNNAVSFRGAITCSFKGNNLADDDLIIQDLKPNNNCITKFIPPDGANLKSEQCKPEVIRKCNSENEGEKREMFQMLCESFNATYVVQRNWKTFYFGNIYCYKCNEMSYEDLTNRSVHSCDASVLDSTSGMEKFKPQHRSLTMFLIPGLIESSYEKKSMKGVLGSCPENQVMVHSFMVSKGNRSIHIR
jgi:hypothetical protein